MRGIGPDLVTKMFGMMRRRRTYIPADLVEFQLITVAT